MSILLRQLDEQPTLNVNVFTELKGKQLRINVGIYPHLSRAVPSPVSVTFSLTSTYSATVQAPCACGRVARWGHAVGTRSKGASAPSPSPCCARCPDSGAEGRLFKKSFVRREQILFELAILFLMLFKL